MPFPQFDRSRLQLLPLAQRQHDVDVSVMMRPDAQPEFTHPHIDVLAREIRAARQKGAEVLVMIGAHVIRAGGAPLLMRLMQQGLVTHVATNGAGAIHDFELAMIGKTCESVAKYIREGQFGLWREDGYLNEAVSRGVRQGLGFGEAVGRYIEEKNFPYRQHSLFAAGYRQQVPVTVHVGIGSDIVHQQSNASGADIGTASFTDFLIYAHTVENLEGGVFLNIGSAVAGPEVYLKALSMARNVAKQHGKSIARFTTAVFDLMDLEGEDVRQTLPKSDARYYFRPWKTILARTVADGGQSYYVRGRHEQTLPALYHALTNPV